jgi:hypothetical protein
MLVVLFLVEAEIAEAVAEAIAEAVAAVAEATAAEAVVKTTSLEAVAAPFMDMAVLI